MMQLLPRMTTIELGDMEPLEAVLKKYGLQKENLLTEILLHDIAGYLFKTEGAMNRLLVFVGEEDYEGVGVNRLFVLIDTLTTQNVEQVTSLITGT